MLNKTDVRKAVNRWLKEVKPDKDESFSVHADIKAGLIMIHLVNPAGDWREDRIKQTEPHINEGDTQCQTNKKK